MISFEMAHFQISITFISFEPGKQKSWKGKTINFIEAQVSAKGSFHPGVFSLILSHHLGAFPVHEICRDLLMKPFIHILNG